MKNTLFEDLKGHQLPREVQLRRLQQVIQGELTETQQEILRAYYFEDLTLQQIARRRGVHKTTVWRTLKRAEKNLRRVMRY